MTTSGVGAEEGAGVGDAGVVSAVGCAKGSGVGAADDDNGAVDCAEGLEVGAADDKRVVGEAEALRFLPALLFLPIWLTIAIREDLLATSFRQYYPLSIAMIFGSLIAGSTPLGGGVVAFPVSVLSIKFTPSQGRDFSLMIQSCGMTAASFLVLTKRPYLLKDHGSLLAKTFFFNVLGLICGAFVVVPPFIAMCIYTTSVAGFAIILAYVERCVHYERGGLPLSQSSDMQQTVRSDSSVSQKEDEESEHENSPQPQAANVDLILVAIFSFIGGFMSSKIGTGADMAWYAYGALVHNLKGRNTIICDNDLTSMSIIVMTVTSIFGTMLRVTTSGDEAVTPDVYHAFIACACFVVLGAPLGSLLLSRHNQRRLKNLFYILAALQLLIFGVVKIRDDVVAWCVIGGSLCLVMFGITITNRSSYSLRRRKLEVETGKRVVGV
eukprot:scaffold724_cov107-Skeletonema_dohrnii-CCMP3373.AAC.6